MDMKRNGNTKSPAVGSTGFVCVGGGGLFAGEIIASRFGRLSVRMSVACRYFGDVGAVVAIGAGSWLPAEQF